jgi:hypothetical protein
MTLVFNEHGGEIETIEEARRILEQLSLKPHNCQLEPFCVVRRPDGICFSFPDSTQLMGNPYSQPLEIVYGFLLRAETSHREAQPTPPASMV